MCGGEAKGGCRGACKPFAAARCSLGGIARAVCGGARRRFARGARAAPSERHTGRGCAARGAAIRGGGGGGRGFSFLQRSAARVAFAACTCAACCPVRRGQGLSRTPRGPLTPRLPLCAHARCNATPAHAHLRLLALLCCTVKPLVRLAGASVAMWLAPLFVIYSETGAIFTDWLGEHLSIKNRYASKVIKSKLAACCCFSCCCPCCSCSRSAALAPPPHTLAPSCGPQEAAATI